MNGIRSLLKPLALLAFVAPVAVALPACGGKKEATHATIKPGEMPDGADWTGVYYNAVFGYLHLIKEGSTVTGRWRTAAGDKWGQMSGEVTGNVLRFEWEQHTIGLVGPNASSNGKGYFVYTRPKADEDDELHGEWGLGGSEVGTKWDAIKQRNQMPDFKSVAPDETQKSRGDNWDESSGGGDKSDKSEKSGSDKGDDWN